MPVGNAAKITLCEAGCLTWHASRVAACESFRGDAHFLAVKDGQHGRTIVWVVPFPVLTVHAKPDQAHVATRNAGRKDLPAS